MRAADVHNERLYYAVKGRASHNYVKKEARHAHEDRYPHAHLHDDRDGVAVQVQRLTLLQTCTYTYNKTAENTTGVTQAAWWSTHENARDMSWACVRESPADRNMPPERENIKLIHYSFKQASSVVVNIET
jgi:hypothetical protein